MWALIKQKLIQAKTKITLPQAITLRTQILLKFFSGKLTIVIQEILPEENAESFKTKKKINSPLKLFMIDKIEI